jgi:hypothetical protein
VALPRAEIGDRNTQVSHFEVSCRNSDHIRAGLLRLKPGFLDFGRLAERHIALLRSLLSALGNRYYRPRDGYFDRDWRVPMGWQLIIRWQQNVGRRIHLMLPDFLSRLPVNQLPKRSHDV